MNTWLKGSACTKEIWTSAQLRLILCDFSPPSVNEIAGIYESGDMQGCVFAAQYNNWIKDAEILMKYAQKEADNIKIQSRDISNIKARSSNASAVSVQWLQLPELQLRCTFWYSVKKGWSISKNRSIDVRDSTSLHKGRLNLWLILSRLFVKLKTI